LILGGRDTIWDGQDALSPRAKCPAVSRSIRTLNDYSADIPLSDFMNYDVILAWSMDGQPLTRRDKGPLWIIYPRDAVPELRDERYEHRWVWQLASLLLP
jgi:hypothetical protein